MRLRRTGDAGTVGKPGRKRGASAQLWKTLFNDSSGRTFARFHTAMQILTELESKDGFPAAVKCCTRPRGSVNVSALRREADQAIVRHVEAMHSQKGEK